MSVNEPQEPDSPDRLRYIAISWLDLATSIGIVLTAGIVVLWVAFRVIQPAPPSTLTISAGPEGGAFWVAAQRYKDILARNGVTLRVIPSAGTLENLERLANPAEHVDLGFVQSGLGTLHSVMSPDTHGADLMSLGSMGYLPLFIFYRGPEARLLKAFKGERIAIGRAGSGTRQLVLLVLKANGIDTGDTDKMISLAGEPAIRALVDGQVDVAIVTGDAAQPSVIADLLRRPDIRFFNFAQARAYTRRFPFLTEVEVPMGVFDLGDNLPSESVHTVVTTAELIARRTLHPALSDLLVEAAYEVHSGAGLLQNAGAFPSPVAHDFPLSPDAARYYKSGKTFLYRAMPFWLASLTDRMIVFIVPLLVVLIPGLKLVPPIYAWRVKARIYRWYSELLAIERRALFDEVPDESRAELLEKLDDIEHRVNRLRLPVTYADQFYLLREHICFVRQRLTGR